MALTSDNIKSIYRDTLGREADDAGLNYWIDGANSQGWDMATTTDAIRNAAMTYQMGRDALASNAQFETAWSADVDPNKPLTFDTNAKQWRNTAGPFPTPGPPVSGGRPPLYTSGLLATARDITPDETVSHQLNQLMQEDSPYMQIARANALQQANSRGLLNSSIAVGAGQKAAIEAALPIAQQDAKAYSDSGMSAQAAGQQLAQTEFESDLAARQSETNFGYQKQLNAQNIGGNISIANNQAALEKALADQKYTWESNLQKQRDEATATLQTTLKQMDVDFDLGKLAQADRDSFGQAAYPIIQQTQAEISKVNVTPDAQMTPEAKQTAIAQLQTQMSTQLGNLGKIYGYELTWEQPEMGLLTQPEPEPVGPLETIKQEVTELYNT